MGIIQSYTNCCTENYNSQEYGKKYKIIVHILGERSVLMNFKHGKLSDENCVNYV